MDVKKKAIICDLDGTLCLFGKKNPYDRDFINDRVNEPIQWLLQSFDYYPRHCSDCPEIIYFSGRNDKYKVETVKWLKKHGLWIDGMILKMRPNGNKFKDSYVKKQWLDEIRKEYDILFVLDDRNQVVDMWRSNGLTCLQVAPGDF